MKRLHDRTALLAVSLIFLLGVSACGGDFENKTCSYCGGRIVWNRLDHGKFWSEKWGQEFENEGDHFYHKWCDKFRKDTK